MEQHMVQKLTKAFQEPSAALKVMVPLLPYMVPAELYLVLLKTLKVEEEMTEQVGNIHPLAINPDLYWAMETSYQASWHLGWHSKILVSCIFNKCQDDSALKTVCGRLHGAIRVSPGLDPSCTCGCCGSVPFHLRCILDAVPFHLRWFETGRPCSS